MLLTTKLVDMKKVFAHVSGQDHINQPCSDSLVCVGVQLGQDVDPGVAVGQLESQGAVMVLQDSGVIVEDGEITARVTEESGVSTRVINIMDDCS